MSETRLSLALKRQRRATQRPALALRLSAAGLVYAFLSNEEQDALVERFRHTAVGNQSPWRDFPSMVAAGPWISEQLATLPPLTIAIPSGDLDNEPAIAVTPQHLVSLMLADPTIVSINGCLLLAHNGAAGLEIFPNHTANGDVISVQVSRASIQP